MTTQRTIQTMRAATRKAAVTASDTPDTLDDMPVLSDIPSNALMRMSGLSAFLGGVGSRTIWRWVRDGRFPPPVKTPSGMTVWRTDDVRAWIAALK